MIHEDELALICDLAETYKIYDYKKLPITKVAIFACGLRPDSRIKMKLTDMDLTIEQMLIASITDKFTIFLYSMTEDGQKGRNKPDLVLDQLSKNKKENDIQSYASGEEFEKAREKLLRQVENGD